MRLPAGKDGARAVHQEFRARWQRRLCLGVRPAHVPRKDAQNTRLTASTETAAGLSAPHTSRRAMRWCPTKAACVGGAHPARLAASTPSIGPLMHLRKTEPCPAPARPTCRCRRST